MQNTITRRGFTQENKNVVIKNGHSRRLLSGIPTTFNNQKEGDPRLQPSGMTPNFNTPLPGCAVLSPQGRQIERHNGNSVPQGGEISSGFTLIELLVVVLIIGILAAVALPQYQFVVEKSRLSEAISIMNSVQKGIDLYVLENGYQDGILFLGESSNGHGKLNIDVENSLWDCAIWGGKGCSSKNFAYEADCYSDSCTIGAVRKKNGNPSNDAEYTLSMAKPSSTGKWIKECYPNDDYSFSDKLCKSLETQGWK